MKQLLPNKETVLKFDGKTKIILAILAVLALPQVWETINNFQENVLTSQEQKAQREHEKKVEELRQQKVLDSILDIERVRFNEQASRDTERIKDNLKYVDRLLNHENNISVWSEHDGGDPIATGSFKYISVLYAENDVSVTDIKRDYYKEPIGKFVGKLISQIKENDYIYYPDLSTIDELNEDEVLKEYFNFIGTKSLIAFKVKSTGKGNYFFSVSFKIKNPHLENDFMKLKLENINNRLRDLIYEVPDHLKYN